MASQVDLLYDNMQIIGRAIDQAYTAAEGMATEISLYDDLTGRILTGLISSIKADRSLVTHTVSVLSKTSDVAVRAVADVSHEGGNWFKVDRIVAQLIPPDEVKGEAPLSESPRTFKVGGYSFRLSLEIREGMEGLRGDDHKIDWATLKRCLNKKRREFQKSIEEKKGEIDLYFRALDGKVLNIFVKYFPKEEVPFVVWTAYYMKKGVVQSRFRALRSSIDFERWYNHLPQSFKK